MAGSDLINGASVTTNLRSSAPGSAKHKTRIENNNDVV